MSWKSLWILRLVTSASAQSLWVHIYLTMHARVIHHGLLMCHNHQLPTLVESTVSSWCWSLGYVVTFVPAHTWDAWHNLSQSPSTRLLLGEHERELPISFHSYQESNTRLLNCKPSTLNIDWWSGEAHQSSSKLSSESLSKTIYYLQVLLIKVFTIYLNSYILLF